MSQVAQLLAEARRALGGDAEAVGEAELLLARVLQRDRSWLIAWPEAEVATQDAARFRDWVARRAAGEPVAHILGERDFWTLRLQVNRHTLIPRPETEHLVEWALQRLPAEAPLRVIDLGTGSGAIALALAAERPAWRIFASDRSAAALAVARANAARMNLPVRLLQTDWLAGVAGPFELIVSNPPYVAEDDPHLAQGDLPREPRSALTAGRDGLDAIRQILAQAPQRLAPGGWLLLEHGHDQAPACRALMDEAGLTEVASGRDLAGHWRFTHGRRLA